MSSCNFAFEKEMEFVLNRGAKQHLLSSKGIVCGYFHLPVSTANL